MERVPIRGDVIRLGQLLKLAGVAGSGAEARRLLEAGEVQVNEEPEARRGRQLVAGDVVVHTPGDGGPPWAGTVVAA